MNGMDTRRTREGTLSFPKSFTCFVFCLSMMFAVPFHVYGICVSFIAESQIMVLLYRQKINRYFSCISIRFPVQ